MKNTVLSEGRGCGLVKCNSVLEGVLLPSEVQKVEMKVKVIVLSQSLLNLSQVLRSHVPNCCIPFPVQFEQGHRAAQLTL